MRHGYRHRGPALIPSLALSRRRQRGVPARALPRPHFSLKRGAAPVGGGSCGLAIAARQVPVRLPDLAEESGGARAGRVRGPIEGEEGAPSGAAQVTVLGLGGGGGCGGA